jgi:hypothetical protein
MKTLANAAAILALAGLMLAGCQRQETPSQTREDVAEAQREGNEEVMEQQAEALDDGAVTRDDTEEIRLAQAESEHKVAMERCEALTGEARDTCKEQADAMLERAKEQARGATMPR